MNSEAGAFGQVKVAVDIARAAPPGDLGGDHVLTRPDGVAVCIRDRRGQMKRFGIGQHAAASGHHEHVDPMRQRDIPHPRGLGQPADAIELDAEDFSNALARDAGRILKRDKAFIDGDRSGVAGSDGGDIVQALTRLLDHDVQVFDGA